MTSPRVRLESAPGGLAFYTPYDKDLVEAMKEMIPAGERAWDAVNSRWMVTAVHGDICATIAEVYLGVKLAVPKAGKMVGVEVLTVEYVGRCQDKGHGSIAWGWVDGSWQVAFPEQVLRGWFAQGRATKPTLYSVLGVVKAADADMLKAAYRRMAKQWHPDVCHEADATEQFRRIQHAWSMLSNPMTRRKYDAGLFFESVSARQVVEPAGRAYSSWGRMLIPNDYRSPLRCGKVTVEGEWRLGKMYTTKILDWQDVVNEAGQTMVSSWPAGATRHKIEWR